MSGTPLEAQLKRLIAEDGPLTIARFMALALGDPLHGYYMSRDPFGTQGDFTTAPEISQMFGELIGLWAAHSWAELGKPSPIHMVELGPGRGTLMADALRAIAQAAPDFADALQIELVETSPSLQDQQAQRLVSHPVRWHRSIDTVPNAPLILIANEFFDALPIRQFERRNGVWHERLVGVSDNRLCFGLSSEPSAFIELDAPEGAVFELCEEAILVLRAIASRLQNNTGTALIIDYGPAQSGFGDSLQAVKEHRFVPPLSHAGEADVTAHVDFARLIQEGLRNGLAVSTFTTQADFLSALGIETLAHRLRQKATTSQSADIARALERLTDRSPKGMGQLFKVLALQSRQLGGAAAD